MSCLWCSDEKLARSLLRALCQEDFQDDNTKETAMLDLCYCIYCVREYHRQKHEYIKKHPEHTKVMKIQYPFCYYLSILVYFYLMVTLLRFPLNLSWHVQKEKSRQRKKEVLYTEKATNQSIHKTG